MTQSTSTKNKAQKIKPTATLGKTWEAAVNLTEGSSQAMASGLRTFGNTLELRKLFDVRAETGVLGAMLKGYVSYFDGMAKVSKNVAESFRQSPPAAPPAEK